MKTLAEKIKILHAHDLLEAALKERGRQPDEEIPGFYTGAIVARDEALKIVEQHTCKWSTARKRDSDSWFLDDYDTGCGDTFTFYHDEDNTDYCPHCGGRIVV